MTLFNIGKKKDEKEVSASVCSCGCSASGAQETANDCCSDAKDGICCIKVLGTGCKSCHKQYENVKQAVKDMGLPVEVKYITDMQKIMEYGVMSMPAIIINDKIAAMGKVLKVSEVINLLSGRK